MRRFTYNNWDKTFTVVSLNSCTVTGPNLSVIRCLLQTGGSRPKG